MRLIQRTKNGADANYIFPPPKITGCLNRLNFSLLRKEEEGRLEQCEIEGWEPKGALQNFTRLTLYTGTSGRETKIFYDKFMV